MEKKITTLFLDIGGVLLSNRWGHDLRQLAVENFQLDKAEMEERLSIMFITIEESKIGMEKYPYRM